MVKLEEVEDEAFAKQQAGDDGEWDTDDGMFMISKSLSLHSISLDTTLPEASKVVLTASTRI